MKNTLLCLTALSMLLLLASCDKDDCVTTGIEGKWEWVKSTGGIGGWTTTPGSLGTTKTLRIDSRVFREYEGDSLIFESPYELVMDTNSGGTITTYINYENGGRHIVTLIEPELVLADDCCDGYAHRYKRE